MDEAVNAVLKSNATESVKREALEIVAKLLGNILANPEEAKYRTIKKDNATLQRKLTPDSWTLLLAAGFLDHGEVFDFPADGNLKLLKTASEVVGFTLQDNLAPKAIMAQCPEPAGMDLQLDEFCISDPRNPECDVGVIPFYFPGKAQGWDVLCGGGFMGNFWEVGDAGISFAPPGQAPITFTNSESAFQACKWWDKAGQFAPLSGHDAFKLKKSLKGSEDWSYGGHGSNWSAMQKVLAAKFRPGSPLAEALLRTGDTFLLEHNAVEGRDKVWSDNKVGDGTNWLGLQLMLIRDELRGGARPWSGFAGSLLDLQSGAPRGEQERSAWHDVVAAAAATVLKRFP